MNEGVPEPRKLYERVLPEAKRKLESMLSGGFSYIWQDSEGNLRGSTRKDDSAIDTPWPPVFLGDKKSALALITKVLGESLFVEGERDEADNI